MSTPIENRLVELSARNDLKLPAYPAVLARVARIVGRHDYNDGELAVAVRADQALAATVLRFANSAAKVTAGSVDSLELAIKLLGAREVVRCAMAGSLGASAVGPGPLAPLRHQVWRDALFAAHICQELASMRKLPQETAFLAGLLHDFGKIVLIATLERSETRCPPLPAAQWLALFEKLHVEVGERVARIWRLPDAVIEVIRSHHLPPTGKAENDRLVAMVHAADDIARASEGGQALLAEDLAKINSLAGFEPHRVAAMLPRIGSMVAAFARPADSARSSGPSWIEKPGGGAAAPPPPPMISLAVSCDRRDGPILYTARRIDWEGLTVTGMQGLAPNALERFSLVCGEREVRVVMNVAACHKHDGEYTLELRPFALSGEAKKDYDNLVRDCRPRAPQASPSTQPTGASGFRLAR